MKTEFSSDRDGWISVKLTAETAAEAAALVEHGLNANADARKVSSVCARDGSISMRIDLITRQDRHRSTGNMRHQIEST